MPRIWIPVALLVVVCASASRSDDPEETPVSKVIKLIEDLQHDIKKDAKAEAKAYDEFACFCKDNTEKKSDSIKELYSDIDELTAEIGDKQAHVAELEATVEETRSMMEGDIKQLDLKKKNCKKWEMEYMAQAEDLKRAIKSIDRAIEILEESKPASASLLQSIRESLALAQALGLPSAKAKSVQSFIQTGVAVDPDDPDYKFHSQGIIKTLEKLHKDFDSRKSELDAEWEKTDASCKELLKNLQTQIDEAAKVIKDDSEMIEELKGAIAKSQENLVTAQGLLSDDQLYLKDLTVKCEDAGRDWDHRMQSRAEELDVLSNALDVLQKKFMDVLKPKLLLVKSSAENRTENGTSAGDTTKAKSVSQVVSLLQVEDTPRKHSLRLLQSVQTSGTELALNATRAKVASFISTEASRIDSKTLRSLATRLGTGVDPFKKVKDLIQALVERLLKEAAEEAEKKGYCHMELNKVMQERDSRLMDVMKLNSQLASLETRVKELKDHVEMLNDAIDDLGDALSSNAKMRAEEKENNLQDIKDAEEGLPAIKEAIVILKKFYKKAGKSLIQASPVDDDTQGTGFQKYKGKFDAATGIVGLLEVIASDFAKTIKDTKAAEATAQADFVLFERAAKADRAGKEQTVKLDEQEIGFSEIAIEKKMDDLKTNMELVDKQNLEYEELVPMCLDTGMSYSERVAKREEEMDALKKALCLLDPEGVEKECK